MRINVYPDLCPDNPMPDIGARVVSFNRRHVNYAHPEDIGVYGRNEYGEPIIGCPGLRRKLDTGAAFLLSYFEHGSCVWSLAGEGPSCRWDTAALAGVLYLPERLWRGKTFSEREDISRSLLKTYTAWCNGEVYCIEMQDGAFLGGVYDVEASVLDEYGADAEPVYCGW